MLAYRGLDALDRVEVAVLAQQARAQRRDQLLRVAAVRRDQLARLVDALLLVEEERQLGEHAVAVLGLGQPCRRHVQEAVEVDAHRGVQDSAQQLTRG